MANYFNLPTEITVHSNQYLTVIVFFPPKESKYTYKAFIDWPDANVRLKFTASTDGIPQHKILGPLDADSKDSTTLFVSALKLNGGESPLHSRVRIDTEAHIIHFYDNESNNDEVSNLNVINVLIRSWNIKNK